LKKNASIAHLALYDIVGTPGVCADLSHINTPAKVTAHMGPNELSAALKDADVVVVPAGVPRKPGFFFVFFTIWGCLKTYTLREELQLLKGDIEGLGGINTQLFGDKYSTHVRWLTLDESLSLPLQLHKSLPYLFPFNHTKLLKHKIHGYPLQSLQSPRYSLSELVGFQGH